MKTTIKNGIYILCLSVLAGLMAACLNTNNFDEMYSLNDAELLWFGLSHTDSLPELANVNFTIDQRGEVGLIYNKDSMAYQTELPTRVYVDYISGAGTQNVLNITDGDSIWVKSSDTIDISRPLTLKVFALDGVTTKIYIAQLNIHQVDPDSLQYFQIASELPFLRADTIKTVVFNGHFLTYVKTGDQIQLYSSTDAINWTEKNNSGLPKNVVIKGIQSKGDRLFAHTEDGELYIRHNPDADLWELADKPASIKVKSILGYLTASPKQPAGLSLIVETDGIHTFAFLKDFIQWEYDSVKPTLIPEDFPVKDFSNHCYQLMQTGRITIFAGVSLKGNFLNTVWSTENGRYWAKLLTNYYVFPILEGSNIFYYNNEFWLMNGKLDDKFNEDIYYSRDGGVTWKTKEKDKHLMPEEFSPRYNASVVTDKDNKYFYVIGGKQDTVFTDVWKGFLNKKEFKQ